MGCYNVLDCRSRPLVGQHCSPSGFKWLLLACEELHPRVGYRQIDLFAFYVLLHPIVMCHSDDYFFVLVWQLLALLVLFQIRLCSHSLIES